MNALMSMFGYQTKEEFRNFLVKGEKEGKFTVTRESVWGVRNPSTNEFTETSTCKTYRANDMETLKKTYDFANNLTQGFLGNWTFAFIGKHDNWCHLGSNTSLRHAIAPVKDIKQLEVEIKCDNNSNAVEGLLIVRFKDLSDLWYEGFTKVERIY